MNDWHDNYAEPISEKLSLDNYEYSRALAIRPDASGFALGTEFLVRAYDAKGTQLWKRPGPGVACGIDFSADGEIVVVAYSDGTIRWLRWSDRRGTARVLCRASEPQMGRLDAERVSPQPAART